MDPGKQKKFGQKTLKKWPNLGKTNPEFHRN